MIKKIYLDMDGVVADFEKRYTEMFGKSPSEARQTKEFNPHWTKFIETEQFKTLDWWPGAQEFLKFIDDLHKQGIEVEMLTSSGGQKHHEKVAMQKVHWLCSKGIPYFANVVSGRKLKRNYATPETILVDDTEDVIKAFNDAGGHGILHKDVGETVEKIKSLLAIH
jgi:beta-phosphoglucomutase-like phosphatase (HAD superfamily)